MSINSKMTAIADAIRAKTGLTGTLTLTQMAEAIADIETGSGKAVTEVTCVTSVSTGKLIGDVNGDGVIDSTDEELASQYMADGDYDEAADLDGDGEISTADLIQISRLIAELQDGQIIAKVVITYDDGTSSTAYLPVDAPAIKNGIDTSDATATADRILAPYTAYVDDVKLTGTMKNNAGKTTTSNYAQRGNDCIYASTGDSGYYDSGSLIQITYERIRNAIQLTANMIASGFTVLGLEGTAESDGGDSGILDSILDGTATEISSETVTSLRQRAFQNFTALTSASFPAATSAGSNAFYGCSGLESVNIPLLTKFADSMFRYCTSLQEAIFPNVTTMDSYSFGGCTSLVKADFSKLETIQYYAFQNCSALEALILRNDFVCSLDSTIDIKGSGIANGTGYVYVPSSLVDSYKAATNWSTYADQIRAIEDYPDITGG